MLLKSASRNPPFISNLIIVLGTPSAGYSIFLLYIFFIHFRNSKKNKKYLDYIHGTNEFRLRKMEERDREECPVRFLFYVLNSVPFPN